MDQIEERLDRIEAQLASPPRAYLPVKEAAVYLGLSKQQLNLWRMKGGGGPAFHRVGRRCLYAVEDLKAFMDDLRQEPLA